MEIINFLKILFNDDEIVIKDDLITIDTEWYDIEELQKRFDKLLKEV